MHQYDGAFSRGGAVSSTITIAAILDLLNSSRVMFWSSTVHDDAQPIAAY